MCKERKEGHLIRKKPREWSSYAGGGAIRGGGLAEKELHDFVLGVIRPGETLSSEEETNPRVVKKKEQVRKGTSHGNLGEEGGGARRCDLTILGGSPVVKGCLPRSWECVEANTVMRRSTSI